VELKELTGQVGTETYKVSAKIALKARDSYAIRQQLWEALKGDRSTLVGEFARVINEDARPALRKKGYADLVIIVDWLEKLVCLPGNKPNDPNSYDELFLHHAPLFQEIDTH